MEGEPEELPGTWHDGPQPRPYGESLFRRVDAFFPLFSIFASFRLLAVFLASVAPTGAAPFSGVSVAVVLSRVLSKGFCVFAVFAPVTVTLKRSRFYGRYEMVNKKGYHDFKRA